MRCNGCGSGARRIRRGLCDTCYAALLAEGERVHIQVRGIAGLRFILKVDMTGPVPAHAPELGPCWIWTGAVAADGYAWFRAGPDEVVPAHVWVHEHVTGRKVPDGIQVDHLCHLAAACPGGPGDLHRRCVSPLHMAAVIPAVNNARSNSVTAANTVKTHCDQGHPLSGDNLYTRPDRPNERGCRACRRAAARRWAAAQRSGTAATMKDREPVAHATRRDRELVTAR